MKELNTFRQYLTEGVIKENKYDIYGDGDVVIDISRATPEQERLIRWESDPENGITEFENSEDAQKFADEIMNLNSAKEVKNYYDNVRGWATVDYLSTSNALNAFVGNKQIPEADSTSPNLKEDYKNDYANSEEDYTDSMVIEKIKDIIKYHELDPSDVMEEIGQEFGVSFEFGRG